MLQIGAKEYCVDSIIDVLKKGFRSNNEYPYIDHATDTENRLENEVEVYSAFPLNVIYVPSLIVTAPTGESMRGFRTIGDDLRTEALSDISLNGITYSLLTEENYGGGLGFDVSIEVCGLSTAERDKVVDWAMMYLRYLFRDDLVKRGVNIEDITYTGEREVKLGSDNLYFATLSVPVYSEWSHDKTITYESTVLGVTYIRVDTILYDGITG